MLFSVIIPAYNAEKYFSECLSSIQGQTFKDFEVVIIDDGSSDSTSLMADKFAENLSSVKVVHTSNQGLLLARRRGLLNAQGEYVVFVDADDCLRSDALMLLSKAIQETNADIVSFQYSRDPSFKTMSSLGLPVGLYNNDKYESIKSYVCRGRFNNLCGKAIRLCHIDLNTNYGAYKGLMHGEDLFQLLPIIDASSSLMQLNDVLYYYRPNDSSSTARYKPSQLEDIIRVNRRLIDYGNKWGGSCPIKASVGEVNQYLYLLKLSELSDSDNAEKRVNFSSIASAMRREGVFNRACCRNLRFDNLLLYIALKYQFRNLAVPVVQLIESLK